jgi:hypothetical protein
MLSPQHFPEISAMGGTKENGLQLNLEGHCTEG